MVTMTKERAEETLQRLRESLPDVVRGDWLDANREDVAQALEQMGPAAVGKALGVSHETLKTWRRRRGLATGGRHAGTASAVPGGLPAERLGPGVDIIDLDRIDDNPWQPRKTVDEEAMQKLAGSIATSGLLQLPMGRRRPGGRVQLAFGHRRVAAIRLLAEEGKWSGGVPVQLKDLSDHQMALFALEENAKRKDINPLEQYLGYQKVIDDGLMNVTELAASVGLDRSTVSNNLRLLKLPKEALEHFRDGDLKAHAARELLTLVAPDHDHANDILAVIKSIKMGVYGGAPDWSIKSVRSKIADRISHGNAQAWRPMWERRTDTAGESYVWSGGSQYDPPTFDVKAFTREHATRVHHIPNGNKTRPWTCHVKEWRRLQSAATRAETRAVKEPLATLNEKESSVYLQALANDPVVQAAQAGETLERAPLGVSMETRPDTGPDERGAEYKLVNEWVAQVNAGEAPEPEILLPDTIREELGLGVLTDEEIERALRRALEADDGEGGPGARGRRGCRGRGTRRPHRAGVGAGTGTGLGRDEGEARDPGGVPAALQGPAAGVRQEPGQIRPAQGLRPGDVPAEMHLGVRLRPGVRRGQGLGAVLHQQAALHPDGERGEGPVGGSQPATGWRRRSRRTCRGSWS